MSKKIIFLFLALLFPMGIFLFLKIFGKNQFDVPVFYQEGKIETPAGCGTTYVAPYTLPDSITTEIFSDGRAPLALIYFSQDDTPISRVLDEFTEQEVSVHRLLPDANQKLKLDALKDCVLLLKARQNIVLIDQQKRIRGYYRAQEREDIDRLLLEISIILKKY